MQRNSRRERVKYERQRGRANWNSKLDEECVREILARLEEGESTRTIARDYGVSHETVSRIGRGLAWAHVTL